MIPYVDFADSKGPLLWLIYGIGYLISPHDYLGVFLLSIPLYTCIFYYLFKISFIFLQDKRKSIIIMRYAQKTGVKYSSLPACIEFVHFYILKKGKKTKRPTALVAL